MPLCSETSTAVAESSLWMPHKESIFSFRDRASHSPGWPHVHCVVNNDIQLLILLPPPPNAKILGLDHHTQFMKIKFSNYHNHM